MMLKLPVSKMEELYSLIRAEKTLHLYDGKSPKKYFFPQSENFVAFKTKGKEIHIEEKRDPCEKFVLFGLKACDCRALELLDRVFLDDPVDTFYRNRRLNGVIVTSACFQPDEICFCSPFNIDPGSPEGDVATWLIGDTLYWKSRTDKGKELTEKVKHLFTLADSSDEAAIKAAQEEIKKILEKLPLNNVSLSGFKPAAMMQMFNSPHWADLYRACLGCGTCTFVCPTCHCYDIHDYDTGKDIRRLRCWDSCMYSDFTLMSFGNPRKGQLERFRQRFMHKLIYFPDKNDGVYACVGCGRCVSKCPVSLNIVKVAKALGGAENVQ